MDISQEKLELIKQVKKLNFSSEVEAMNYIIKNKDNNINTIFPFSENKNISLKEIVELCLRKSYL